MKKSIKIASLILAAVLLLSVVSLFSSCGKRNENEMEPDLAESTAADDTTTTLKTIEISDIETTSEKETETTSQPETTTKKTEPSTVKQEPSTKKTEPTTRKQEPATQRQEPTTKKQEPTTRKEEPTTKKQEPTTKREEPTTRKEEPTTKKPEPSTTQPTTTVPAPTQYSCGSPNHRCKTPEDHEFLVSLEAKGCPICGSHSCRSFYVIDEWGNQSYDVTKCPEYKVEEDPAVYCDFCGRVCGLGDNGTCVRFTVDTECPICGKLVPAKTCHTHK